MTMMGRDVEAASSDDHIALGTIVPWSTVIAGRSDEGYLIIQVDHLESVPRWGQRVKIVDGWDAAPSAPDPGDSSEQPTNPTGDTHG